MSRGRDALQLRPMTPGRFRQTLAELGLPQARLQRLLDLDKMTTSRWATGASTIPVSVALLLRLMAEGTVTIDELEAHAAVDGVANAEDAG